MILLVISLNLTSSGLVQYLATPARTLAAPQPYQHSEEQQQSMQVLSASQSGSEAGEPPPPPPGSPPLHPPRPAAVAREWRVPEAEPAAAWPGPLVQLPDDALLAVCAHLGPGSVTALGGTCRRLYTVTAAPHLWRDFCAARWRRPLLHLSSTEGEGAVLLSCSLCSQLLARCKLVWQAAACLPTVLH